MSRQHEIAGPNPSTRKTRHSPQVWIAPGVSRRCPLHFEIPLAVGWLAPTQCEEPPMSCPRGQGVRKSKTCRLYSPLPIFYNFNVNLKISQNQTIFFASAFRLPGLMVLYFHWCSRWWRWFRRSACTCRGIAQRRDDGRGDRRGDRCDGGIGLRHQWHGHVLGDMPTLRGQIPVTPADLQKNEPALGNQQHELQIDVMKWLVRPVIEMYNVILAWNQRIHPFCTLYWLA